MMAGLRVGRTALVISVLALAGCAGGTALPAFLGGTPTGGGDTEDRRDTVRLVERDVEAPEVFQTTTEALWDGRPSLGGVWVASSEVDDPERVIIRNPANERFVIGALYRREEFLPGPDLQVSSDAAGALGMVAGAPATLEVTALRREEQPQADAEAESANAATQVEADGEDPAAPRSSGAVETLSLDDVTAGAAAAIDAVEAAEPETAPADPAARTAERGPLLQIGFFSVETNATRAADLLRSEGIVPSVLREEARGKTFWRVVVGPVPDAEGRDAVREQVAALGFEDAYFVNN